jgi:hypothetical protein
MVSTISAKIILQHASQVAEKGVILSAIILLQEFFPKSQFKKKAHFLCFTTMI